MSSNSLSTEEISEMTDDFYSRYVDRLEPFEDDSDRWSQLSSGVSSDFLYSEEQLDEVRASCRQLSLYNEFAVNAHENRINYLVGPGHCYTVYPKRNAIPSDGLIPMVELFLADLMEVNHWHRRQQEIVKRTDRDGEVFIRLFFSDDGLTRIRFVDPEYVRTPTEVQNQPSERSGISFDPQDAETVRGYWIDQQFVPAEQIQHRKANVDLNVPRGLPLFFPVRNNLRRAEKLLRNMSVVAEIQSAIAIIRRHQTSNTGTIERFVNNHSSSNSGNFGSTSGTGSTPGFTPPVNRYGPGTILDTSAAIEYQFPVSAIDASRYVTVLQAELRAIAARLVMPEFMLTSDASNANYSSTMIAEGPAVRMFQRLQHELTCEDVSLFKTAIRHAIRCGHLPPDTLNQVEIHAIAPTLAVRDRLRETQADKILFDAGILSRKNMAIRNNIDPKEIDS